MRYPLFLKDGGTIGVPAPSFGCTTEPYKSEFESAVKMFEGRGFRVLPGDNCFCDCGTGISNTPEKCGEELTRMYVSGDTDVLISCGGGELMCEAVPFIDMDAVRNAAPKWFMGYSDNTNFTHLSVTLADTAAIYGPNFPSFGMEPLHRCHEDALELLTGSRAAVHGYDKWELESLRTDEEPLVPYNLTEDTKLVYHPAEARGGVRMAGRLLGGCLDCLSLLAGTRFDGTAEFVRKYREDGIIWFIEACDLEPISIRRAMWKLKNTGWFENAAGFLIGRPYMYGREMMGVDQYNAVTSMIGDLGVPVIMDADIGHLPPQMPIVAGACAEVYAENNDIEIKYSFS